jgi:ATP-dependent helicase/nuclease subunit B
MRRLIPFTSNAGPRFCPADAQAPKVPQRPHAAQYGWPLKWSLTEIFGALEQGAVLLTATRRLARVSRIEFTSWQRDRGRSLWKSPQILPLDAYVRRLWENWLAQGPQGFDGVLLTTRQESLVWEQIIRESPEGESLLQTEATARRAMDAWRLIHAWRLPLDDRYKATEDCEAFLGWAQTFERRCVRGKWLDAARLPDFVLDRIRRNEIEKPAAAWYSGFDELTPQQREFLTEIGAAPHEPPLQRTVTRTRVCATAIDEIRCAAAWARRVLEDVPAARVGVVVPSISRLRAKVERIFREELQPGSAPEAEAAFHVSLGRPLSEYPMIRATFLALEFAAGPMALTKTGMLLRSPFLGGAEEERNARGSLDARLRRFEGWEVSIDDVRRQAGTECPKLSRSLKRLSCVDAGPQSHTQWSGVFSDCLRAIGWPGDRTPNSHEHQLMLSWTETLSEFSSMDAIAGPVPFREAVERLRAIANSTIFQFEDTGAPVQISDHIEIVGVRFDRLWVMGLDDEAFPPAADPNPFLPVSLQWEYRVPHSSAERQAEFGRTVFERLTASAPDVVLSFAQTEGDRTLSPSPLLTATAHPLVADPPAWITKIRAAAELETFIDDTDPPHTEEGVQRGGAKLLQDMAACPFRAFAAHRLGAKELESVEAGLGPGEKGTATHQVLQRIWSELQSHAALCALAPDALTDLVRRHIADVLSRYDVNTNTRVEAIRLERLLLRWLQLERSRAPFTVVKLEEKKTIEVGGLHLEIRADRIDEIGDGRQIILDYKTGDVKSRSWTGPRLDEPQLPLYCITSEAPIAGAVFARIQAEGMEFAGIAEEHLPEFRSYAEKNGPPLPTLVGDWRQSLTSLAAQFRSGDARVDPKYGDKTCEYCKIVPLCRIREETSDV